MKKQKEMSLRLKNIILSFVLLMVGFPACKTPGILTRNENKNMPEAYLTNKDTNNTASIKWKEFFTDSLLISLIDTALVNNQELNITLLEIQIAKNEVRSRKGEYLPFIGAG